MNQIFGTFILAKENGQYKGEYFNNKMQRFSNEDIQAMEVSGHNEFIGSFNASWQESSGVVTAVLEIDMEQDDIYILTWKDVSVNGDLQNVNFTGRGVMRNGLLVCIYSMHSASL
jgi:hypothetical protein